MAALCVKLCHLTDEDVTLFPDLKNNRGKYKDKGSKVAKEGKKGEDKDRDKFDR